MAKSKAAKYKVPAAGRKLLLRVKKHILEEPKRLRMAEWMLSKEYCANMEPIFQTAGTAWGEPPRRGIQWPSCGTTGCIAGWMELLANGMPEGDADLMDRMDSAQEFASKVLEFDKQPWGTYTEPGLFFVSEWPYKFAESYSKAKTQAKRAKIVAAVIDDFLADPEPYLPAPEPEEGDD